MLNPIIMRIGNPRPAALLLLLAALACAVGIFVGPGDAWAQEPGQPGYTGPELEIPIPGVEFSGIIRDNEYITIPWLGQYIGGVYTFLISIVGAVAAAVMIVGGFQYVTSAGDSNKLGKAKKRIVDAMIGLLLAFGSYTILYAINPDLTQFEGLKIANVQTDLWDKSFDTSLGTTTEVTSDETVEAIPPSGDGEYTPVGACPFVLSQPRGSKAAKLEFYSLVPSKVDATGKREKVLQIAAIADACDVNLGSCGATAGAINALAGVGSTACLADASSCNDDSKGPEMFAISGRQRREIYGRNCALWTSEEVKGNCIRRSGKSCLEYEKITKAEATRRTLTSVWKKYTPDPGAKAKEVQDNCFRSGAAATDVIRKYLLDEAAAGRLPKDWPDAWAKRLNPGDRLVVYNGNNDLVGSHAVIFVGWAANGKMNVVQGGTGGRGNQKNVTRPGTICVTSACGKNFTPLINGWSPD